MTHLRWLFVGGFILGLLAAPTNANADEECKAPESVKKLAELFQTLFDGSRISCDDGNSFSPKNAYDCVGNKYVSKSSPDNITVTSTGEKVLVVEELSEKNGKTVLTEIKYASYEAFEKGEKPLSTLDAHFLQLSEKSILLYSPTVPKDKSWITSVWFLDDKGKTRGYKNLAHRTTTCQAVSEEK